ncbi:MarR family transcriptional regulator [Phyllobacterium sp. 21LDTY02-6]|jgi:DNA-binding MarR family transcriptional regulator|uniref:MarR family winged helix-turn-helix transcriptional regulator n=1 Tax=unclassified Phyllobacterium TaxID=2638441 RepID=UPI0020216ABD|nr:MULTISPECIES: MarR family transcriptional regulator [unclassified Phyllobacterium]MCO4315554.1 MarR family transcriptional regulator [Phyllobacterium sp. 21LDTY02-6]MCX8281033.1 MarR family transcriptional regulator [Phyllobacterium sp. 0TCS1.6C]MCX8295899.1 MarR family transcriptional regulator [Phyllobacterium sp. 0TCS1.6A]
MVKDRKPLILHRLQATARLTRTALAIRLLGHGLYAGQDAVMLQLAHEDGLSPSVLAKRLGVRPPTITKTISRLQAQGFVKKEGSATDQRQAHIFLTVAGNEAIKSIEKSIRKTEKDAMKGFDKKDRKTLVKMLSRLEMNLSAADLLRQTGSEDVDDDSEDE